MKLLEVICKELGVEVGEEWLGNDGNRYKIEGDFIFRKALVIEAWGFVEEGCYWKLLTGKLKPIWEPEKGDTYYTPNPAYFTEEFRFTKREWGNTLADYDYLKNNMIFKNKEEAIEVANKMLAALEEDE